MYPTCTLPVVKCLFSLRISLHRNVFEITADVSFSYPNRSAQKNRPESGSERKIGEKYQCKIRCKNVRRQKTLYILYWIPWLPMVVEEVSTLFSIYLSIFLLHVYFLEPPSKSPAIWSSSVRSNILPLRTVSQMSKHGNFNSVTKCSTMTVLRFRYSCSMGIRFATIERIQAKVSTIYTFHSTTIFVCF